LIGIIALLPILLLGVIIGPQDLHYYNLIVLTCVTLVSIYSLIKARQELFKNWKNTLLTLVAIVSLFLFYLVSKFWVDNRYGYTNWTFKNPLTMYFDRNETNEKWTNYSLQVLMKDIVRFKDKNIRYPKSIDELPPKEGYRELEDSWGNEIIYEVTTDSILLKSAGTDLTINTEDDIILRKEKTVPNTVYSK
jgi:hypothetical protein